MTSTRSSRSARLPLRAVTALAGASALVVSALAAPWATAAPVHASPAVRSSVGAAALPAAPQGMLPLSGCSRSGTTDSCELWARTGSTSLLGTPMPIWGYAASAAGAATAPGPVLVVREGDTINVALHNDLPQATALAFPGQPATSFSGASTGGTVAGVPNGGTATYTFTATEPGTFLYEAGHTPNGARQVAMGLAGALVVLPANGTGAYGSNLTAYDDESVLVLGEIDPALNTAANPAAFDMRRFQARYRTINGKVFPSTDPVATGVGRTVLLRYVNAGAVAHSMGLLGGAQLRIAQDAHPAALPTTSLVADLAPGATMDTLVTMPSGGGSKLTLYEAGGHLDNNGMTEGADQTQIATGGMLTFLDTAAPPPTTDAVGPVPSRLTVAPSPADGTVPVVVTAEVSDRTTGNAAVDAVELVADDATSQQPGFGLAMTATDGAFDEPTEQVTGTIPVGTSADPTYCDLNPITLSCLSAGKHRIFVRGHDAAGNWGVISDISLNLPKTGPLTRNGYVTPDPANGAGGVDVSATGDDSGAGGSINAAEWSLDAPAAPGSGTTMTVGGGGTIAAVTGHVPAAAFTALAEGTHHVFVRSHDSLGLWGSTLDIPFTVDKTGPTVNAAAVAPNPTNGKLSDPGNPGNLVVSANIIDSAGGLVSGAEGFLDPGAAPAPGSGFKLVAVDGSFDTGSESVYGLIPLSQVTVLSEGSHRVVVRGKDNAGNWGDLFNAPLVVDRVAPALGALTASPNPTNGAITVAITGTTSESSLNAAEIWLGTTDPGAGRGTPETLTVNPAGTQVTVTVAVPPFSVGTRRVNVRIQDKAGNWSNVQAVVITARGAAAPTTAAGLLGFDAGVGNLVVSATAGMPPGGGNLGVIATAAANQPAYVSAATTTPAHGLSSSFLINRRTLRTAVNGILTLYDGRTSTGGSVFAVQMRTTSATGAQIRAVLTRNNGTTVIGNWFALNTAANRVSLTWVSGPAAGANRGQLRVTLGNTVLINQFANTTGRTLASVRLGVVDGSTPTARSGMTGSLYLDDYTAMGVQ